MSLDFSNTGYVYILTNESFPNLIKIGYTKNDPEHRAKELSSTGVPTPFRVWHYSLVENANDVEEAIHVSLFKNRTNKDREFFCISPESAKNTMDRIILEQRENFLTKQQKQKQEQYNNPKFVELIKFLKSNQGKLFSTLDLAKELKISEKGLSQVLYMVESQETTVLYVNPDPKQSKKYGIYVKFGEPQLDVLDKKYPLLNFSEVRSLFNNKSSNNNKFNNNSSNTFDENKKKTINKFSINEYRNPRLVDVIKVLKENQGKRLIDAGEIANRVNAQTDSKIKISEDGVSKIISTIESLQLNAVFIIPEQDGSKERFGIDFDLELDDIKKMENTFKNLDFTPLFKLFTNKKKEDKYDINTDKKFHLQLKKHEDYNPENKPKASTPKFARMKQKQVNEAQNTKRPTNKIK